MKHTEHSIFLSPALLVMTHTAVRHRTQAPSGGGAQEPDKNDGAPSFRGRDRSFFVTALFLSHATACPPAGHPSLASKTDPKSSRLLRTSRDGTHPGHHSLLLAVLASDSSHCLHSLSPTKQAVRPSKRCQPDDIIPCSEPSNGFLSHLMEVGGLRLPNICGFSSHTLTHLTINSVNSLRGPM